MYITFDNYYTIEEYIEFIQAAKNNNVVFKEFISIRQPYLWYVQVETPPQFVNYDVADKDIEKWLVSKLDARYPNEEYLLQRRVGSNKQIEKYISPDPLKQARTEPYFLIFKSGGIPQLMELSKEIPEAKLWDLGDYRGYKYVLTFNKYFKGHIPLDKILLEKTNPKDFSNPGEIEQYINYKILIKEKMINKTIELPFVKNGKYYPLKRNSTI